MCKETHNIHVSSTFLYCFMSVCFIKNHCSRLHFIAMSERSVYIGEAVEQRRIRKRVSKEILFCFWDHQIVLIFHFEFLCRLKNTCILKYISTLVNVTQISLRILWQFCTGSLKKSYRHSPLHLHCRGL